MKRNRKIVIIIIIVLAGWGFYKLGNYFGGGSYPNAEPYEIGTDEKTLINMCNDFKKENPDYSVPGPDGRDSSSYWYFRKDSVSYWYFIYFYYKDKNEIILTWTRFYGKHKCLFALVSINHGLQLGHWKDVNRDYGFFENRKIKKEFEERILNKIKEKIN